jgi:hypothetical protein
VVSNNYDMPASYPAVKDGKVDNLKQVRVAGYRK